MSRLSLRRSVILAFFLLSLVPWSASCQVTEIKVQIINSPPKAYGMYSTSVVKSNQPFVVWCGGTVEDLNSFKDITSESAYRALPSSGGYIMRKDSDFLAAEQKSVIRGSVLAGYVLDPTTQEGQWSCIIEAIDNAGDRAANHSSFSIYPTSCANGVRDNSEESVDCGGPCMPCSCINGVKDGVELGVDCGGPCGYCTDKGSLSMTRPSEVTLGEVVAIQVNDGNKGVRSLIRAIKPGGKYLVFTTDDSGVYSFKPDETGVWEIKADLYGYAPTKAAVKVKASMVPYIIGAVLLLAVVVILLVIMKNRSKGGGQEAPLRPSSP